MLRLCYCPVALSLATWHRAGLTACRRRHRAALFSLPLSLSRSALAHLPSPLLPSSAIGGGGHPVRPSRRLITQHASAPHHRPTAHPRPAAPPPPLPRRRWSPRWCPRRSGTGGATSRQPVTRHGSQPARHVRGSQGRIYDLAGSLDKI